MALTQQVSAPASDSLARDLAARQNEDGGWGAGPGAVSNPECTALAYLALAGGRSAAEREAAARWLLERQEPNGSWRYYRGGPDAPWPTPIALLALHHRQDAAAVERGFAWLLEQRSKPLDWWIRVWEVLTGKQVVEHDTTLDGWSWVPGTAVWVEPTAWALMALKARWPGNAPRAVRGRIREGEAMIRDRECPGGGWNYGNKRVLGQDLEPYPDTTALALLGLHGRESSTEVERGFAALDRLLDEHASGLALSLGALSRRAWGRDAADLQARLTARYLAGAFAGEHRTLAIALLAFTDTDWLGAGRSPHA